MMIMVRLSFLDICDTLLDGRKVNPAPCTQTDWIRWKSISIHDDDDDYNNSSIHDDDDDYNNSSIAFPFLLLYSEFQLNVKNKK